MTPKIHNICLKADKRGVQTFLRPYTTDHNPRPEQQVVWLIKTYGHKKLVTCECVTNRVTVSACNLATLFG